MQIKLRAKKPFSLSSVIHSHGWARLSPFDYDDEKNSLEYTIHLKNGRTVHLQIEETADGVVIKSKSNLGTPEEEEITDSVTWMLALNEEFSEFYELARREPKLQHVEDKAQGRLLRSPTLFEDTVKTILTTNTAWGGTIRMTEAFVNRFGDTLPEDTSRHAFPTPNEIAKTDEETLRNDTRLGYRAPYILQLARDIVSGELDLESMKDIDLPTEDVRKKLLAIKGIGNYAAANLLMLVGHYNYLTIDSWAFKMVSHEFFGGKPISRDEVEQVFEKWGKWKGLAYWLWDWSYPAEQ